MENNARKTSDQVCHFCGHDFHAQRGDAKYCSNKCRQGAYLIGGAEKYVRKQLERLENRYEYLKRCGKDITKREIQDMLWEIKRETEGWWFRRLPYDNKLRLYVEDTLITNIDALHILTT